MQQVQRVLNREVTPRELDCILVAYADHLGHTN
jgi:hypothetical protein